MEFGKDILEPILTVTVLYIGLWLKDKKFKKPKGLEHTTTRLIKSKNLLAEIREELDADRVQLWDGSNGTTSLSGYHIQRLSMFTESNRDGLPDIAHKFENVPSQKMQRNLLRLADATDSYIISYEHLENDDISKIYVNYEMSTVLLIRIESSKKGWVGILLVGWGNERSPSSYEVAFAKLKASQLGTIDKP